jgi:hypothetical protein
MTMMRIVLPKPLSEGDVDALAWNLDWSFVKSIKASEDTPHEVIWQDLNDLVNIHYLEDFYIDFAYLVLRGEAWDALKQVEANILEVVPVCQTQAFFLKTLEVIPEDINQVIYAIYGLGLTAPQTYEFSVFSVFQKLTVHLNSVVRSSAIIAIGYIGWPEFKTLLAEIQIADPDVKVQKDAEVMLSGFELHCPSVVLTS